MSVLDSLNLSDPVRDYVRRRIANGKSKSIDDLVEELALEAIDREKEERLVRRLERSRNSGVVEFTPDFAERKLAAFKARHGLA